MHPETYSLSQDEFNAHMLAGVMDATAPPGEAADAGRLRRAAIVEMFRTFQAADPMESMIACHCITLHFLLNAAMRDAANVNLEPAMLTKVRASAVSISKTWHLWMAKYESLHARNEARAAEAMQKAAPQAAPAEPKPAPAQPAPAQSVKDAPPLAPFRQPSPPMPAAKQALLSSTAIQAASTGNGRLGAVPAS